MSSVVLSGNTSGAITVEAPDIAGTNTITLPAASGIVALTNTQIGMKNRIINGAMMIDQRYAGTAYTSTNGNFYVLDRWTTLETGGVSNRFTVQQNAGSVTPPAGFTNYLGVTSLVASAVTAGMIQTICQKIEGFNASDLAWGTANAKTITVSFWVRSSLTGTFGGVMINGAFNYSYPFTYTISSANTWEYKTVTIAGPTAGAWNTTNGAGPSLQFVIGTGTTFQGAAGSWSANGFYGVTGAVDVTSTNGATFYITGVQLEVGSTATSFDYRPYGTELALCQRYFINWVGNATGSNGFPMVGSGNISSSTAANIFIPTPVSLRATPTVSLNGTVNITDSGAAPTITSISGTYLASSSGFWVQITASGGGLTTGRGTVVYVQNASTNSFSASSEL